MDELTHGGTPPPLWPKVRAPQNTTNYQSRIAALAKQVEKLSWMVENSFAWYIEPEYGFTMEVLEAEWQREHASPS